MHGDSILATSKSVRRGADRPAPSRADVPASSLLPLGAERVDAELGGGLKGDGLHEFYAARTEDGIGALGFALGLARRALARDARPLLWLRLSRGPAARAVPYGPGLAELGLPPNRLTLLLLPDGKALLRAALDAVRSGAPGAVLLDLEGPCPLLDLTASRRLTLAAEETGTMVLMVRGGARPVPSAAHSRWEVAAAPSPLREGDVPGGPAFALTLLRHRGGRDGFACTVAWDRDGGMFRETERQESEAPASLSFLPAAANDRKAG